ncbi:MAG: LysM peptidoglycan-binding domain-containing protein [Planctomycetota bacterium]|jgi:LysM repeat protein
MTKETKIGLLVGCFVIILIGILISDHLANVQLQEPAQIAEAIVPSEAESPLSIFPDNSVDTSYAAVEPSRPLPLPEELVEPEPEPELEITPFTLRQDLPMPARIDTPTSAPMDSSATSTTAEGMTPDEAMPELFESVNGVAMPNEVAANDTPGEGTRLGFGPGAPRGPVEGSGFRNPGERSGFGPGAGRGPRGGNGVGRPGTNRGEQGGVYGQRQATANPRPGVRFAGEGRRLNPPAETPTNNTAASGAITRPQAPPVTWHTVKEGETLSDISRIYYNTSKHYQRIYEANRNKIPSVDRVRHGVRIVIPPLPSAEPIAQPQPTAPQPAPTRVQAPTANRPASVKTYIIKENDTLSSIAAKFYGTSKAWYKLYELNKDRISDPDRVKPGLEINVPVQ